MNEKYKFIMKDADGNEKTFIENHPDLTVKDNDTIMGDALNVVSNIFNYDPVRVDLTSDTTIYVEP